MKVYTVQHLVAYRKMREQGFLVGDEKYVWEEFKEPYHWMMKQMEKRIEGYNAIDYPIWLWRTRVDRNSSGLFPRGTKGVILTLEIPDDQILWSDFNLWHCVLNNGSVTGSEEEENILEESGKDIQYTWERIFDFDWFRNADPKWVGKYDEFNLQGVTPKITLDMVKKVTRFIAKGSNINR
ncbi:DUF3841 domain-containing protein [Heyndrickxia vini]|uniref:DUF3841 domain-containing protein n=1 Tax=Heyndrickxia vini TaxID=1476025 RepID=A0ABX7DZS4_9BACI|nr:DUF3841 domain-containing protein [Heyndrickxia vini]QQZ08494.1 DUF3841 domain-containing protein [Heyndrickxia vini]